MVSLSRSRRSPTSSAPGMTVPLALSTAPVVRLRPPNAPMQALVHGDSFRQWGSDDVRFPRGKGVVAPRPQAAGWGSARPRTHTCSGRTGSGYQAAWIQAKGKLPGDETPAIEALMPGSTPETAFSILPVPLGFQPDTFGKRSALHPVCSRYPPGANTALMPGRWGQCPQTSVSDRYRPHTTARPGK